MSLSAQAQAVIFGVIGAASFVTNFLFCLMLRRKRTLLKKPHNILLLTLANIDMMTGNSIPDNIHTVCWERGWGRVVSWLERWTSDLKVGGSTSSPCHRAVSLSERLYPTFVSLHPGV